MEIKECIFCLCDVPKTKQIESPCDCRPHLHQRCLNKWYKTEPNTCPICRLNYETVAFSEGVETEVSTFRNLSNEKKLSIILTFVGVVYLIFLLYVID